MKNLLLVPIFLLFVGCGLFPQPYDNNEYEMLVNLSVQTEELHDNCQTNNTNIIIDLLELQSEARVFEVYTEHTPNNDEVAQVATVFKEDIAQLLESYADNEHNRVYCERKTDLMLKKLEPMLQVIPTKGRK